MGGLNGKNISRKPKHSEGYDSGEGSSRSRQKSKPTRRAKTSILNPQPDYNEKIKNVKIVLLQNGHINRRLKKPILAMNTCAVDAIIHLFTVF